MERMESGAGETDLDRKRLKRLAAGDLSALGEIYDAHADRILRHALWITRRRQEAEDVVQNVMARIAGMGPGLLGIRRPAAYLLTMARREALDLLERRREEREAALDEALLVADGSDPSRAAEAAAAGKMLATLDVAQREVVHLHLYEGFTFREIGAITGVSTFTAASRYRLALERLRKEWRAP